MISLCSLCLCGENRLNGYKRAQYLQFFGALIFAFVSIVGPIHSQETAQSALEAQPSSTGALTWWLCSPTLKQSLAEAKPPRCAREGQSLTEGAADKWSLFISALPFLDLRPVVTARSGMVWVSTQIHCETAGARKVLIRSYCNARVFQDQKLILDKAQPRSPYMDEAKTEVEFPKGVTELVVGISIRSGYCGFQLNLTEGRKSSDLPKPVVGDLIRVPTVIGKEPDANAAVLAAASFLSENIFVSPGQSAGIELGFYGSLPVVQGPLVTRWLGHDGVEFGEPLPARAVAELSRNAWKTSYSAPVSESFSFELSAELKSGAKTLGVKKLTLFSLPGLNRAANEMEADIARRSAQSKRSLPFAALAVEKLKLYLAKINNGEERVTREMGDTFLKLLTSAKTCADLEEAGKDPGAGKSGYFERAYTSRIDEQPQPYFMLAPAAYAASEKKERFPLIVFLHGYVPSYDKHRWWDEMSEFNAVVDSHNCFLAIPFGRSNTDFQACGEVDVLDVIAEVKRLYPIDDDRVYLYGYSMGGMAVYSIGAHYPDLFAAGVVFCGRADSPLQNFRPLTNFHPFKQWLIHADNPISLCENFSNIPLAIYHGRDDFIINSQEAVRMEKRFREVGANVQFSLYPGDHWTGFDIMCTEQPVQWLLQHKRNNNPAQRYLKTYNLRYASQGEVQVTATTGTLQPIELAWTMKDGVAQFTRNSDQILQLKVKDALIPEKVEGSVKSPQLCGPIREAICGPFVIVYGTSGVGEANARNKANAEKFAQEWYAFTRSRAILKADQDVTDSEKKNKNLFLFGEEQDNRLHAAVAKELPFAVKGGEVTIGDKKTPLTGKGFMYIYPSPFADAPKRCSVVICAGLWYGKSVGTNHKFDLLP
ncbi:MAG: alpha/beta fold hydrolase, partial [Planctomycetota bacterium]